MSGARRRVAPGHRERPGGPIAGPSGRLRRAPCRAGPAGPSRALLALAVAALAACSGPGDVPVAAPGEPIPGLGDAERGRFLLGRALFERVTAVDEGLGPLFNAERCSDCHDVPAVGGGGTRILVQKATRFADGRCDPLRDRGGDNVQARATRLLEAHGLSAEAVPAEADGRARVTAPPLFGLGLVEAVPTADLEALADPDDADGDGISGRLPRLADGRDARFGRKGDAANLPGFIDTALRFELGLTTPLHPEEERPNGVPLPAGADPAPDPEMDERALGLLADYVRFLAAPAPEAVPEAERATVRRGEALFGEMGCADCHRPSLRAGPDAPAGLAGRTFRPYSDFLVHDLGGADGDVCGADVAPGELRTAALWGLRHRARYLHDGAAADLTAAIARHGGEAASRRDAFFQATPDDRGALLRFLESL